MFCNTRVGRFQRVEGIGAVRAGYAYLLVRDDGDRVWMTEHEFRDGTILDDGSLVKPRLMVEASGGWRTV